MNVLAQIIEDYPDEYFLKADGFDDAIIGIDQESLRLIYSVDKMKSILMTVDEMSEDDARDYLDFNVLSAYMGEKNPIYCIIY